MHNKAGLYLHIPFCEKKCAYCDFYSVFFTEEMIDKYLTALIREIKEWGGRFDRPIDTIYIGGGTPSLLGKRIEPLLKAVYQSFNILDNAEITAEINPDATIEFLKSAYAVGVNRLSMGVQSGNDGQLKRLGRSHLTADAKDTVARARQVGFSNISLDLMLCLPESNIESLKESIDFLVSLKPNHISAYMLKIEENTKFYYDTTLMLPDEEQQSEQYLFACEYLSKKGFLQYEISNFALKGFESRHNLKYWLLEEYLGIGPAAHSFVGGKRFYYKRDLKEFIKGTECVFDGVGGDAAERLMLGLRLCSGISLNDYCTQIPVALKNELDALKKASLINYNEEKVSLTPKGMLVSNRIITDILELLYENF